VRKSLTASLSACLVAATFTGCGDKSEQDQVSDQLETLLDEVSRLQYADAPIDGNNLEYTLGKEVDGVKVPGSIRFEAAYLDQATALLPLANDIVSNGTEQQKQSAYSVIGTIRTDEAAFLIDEAERAFQAGAHDVVGLRNKISVLREIEALKASVAGDREEIIETYRTGLDSGPARVTGINGLEDEAEAAAAKASEANSDYAEYTEQLDELQKKVAEYEALELQLSGQARSSQGETKYDKLDQATAAAKEAEMAQAKGMEVEIDAWIAERMANLAEFKRQQLAGAKDGGPADLLGKLDGFLAQSAEETNIPASSDIYSALASVLTQAKSMSGNDTLKAAAFMLGMSDYATAATTNSDQRRLLAAAMNTRIGEYLGLIGELEMKIAQIKLDRQRMADRLAQIDADRQRVIGEFQSAFNKHDAMIQAAAFGRMNAAIDALEAAEKAVQGSGRNTDMELMSVYTLHARALQQQSVSARLYQTTLSSMAAAGPELLGSELHGTLTDRAGDMQTMLEALAGKVDELQAAVSVPATSLIAVDPESKRGEIAAEQMEVYESLLASIAQSGAPAAPAPEGVE
jgi:hypothetical protein